MSRWRPIYRPLIGVLWLVLVIPVSPNYQLRELDVTSGGGISQSANYGAEQSVGQVSTTLMRDTDYGIGLGFGFSQMVSVPSAPSLTNPSNLYDQLHLTINPGLNPTDTVFLVALSTDNFATTQYLQPDNTLSSSLSIADYQTYAGWGGASGVTITGLSPSTTYQARVKAKQGNYTETGYGPAASASTVASQLSFDIDVSPTDQSTNPPYATNLGSLLPNTVITGPDKIWASFDTNANSGGSVYVSGQQGGLYSATANHLISSASGDLSVLTEGFGLQGSSATQASGGPFSVASTYHGSGDTVGVVDNSIRPVFSSPGPVTTGRGSVWLKAKASPSTPAATDYSEVLTMIGAATF